MNMKDIADLSGVSISTVSKVLNNKSGDISEHTREKVFSVARTHNYMPYGIKNGIPQRTHILAVIIPSLSKNYFSRLLEAIEHTASIVGYTISVHCSNFDTTHEQSLVNMLEKRECDGIILATFSKTNAIKSSSEIPIVVIGVPHEVFPSFYFDYAIVSEKAVTSLLESDHKSIGCILEFYVEEFTQGAKLAISQAGLSTDTLFCTQITAETDIEKNILHLTSLGVTAFFCSSMKIAARIYKFAAKRYWEIPKDFSLIAFEDELVLNVFFPDISTVRISLEKNAVTAVRSLIDFIDKGSTIPQRTKGEILIYKTESVLSPLIQKEKRIVVIGSLNMDTILSVTHLPQAGETIMTRSKFSIPGGKGANQAVGVGLLDGQVSIIGRLGDDLKGREIYRNLLDHKVNVEGVVFDTHKSTGSAYIMVDEKGNNTIAVHGGANDWFDSAQLETAKKVIANSAYALIQTEIPLETVKTAMKLCEKSNVKVILKPAPAVRLPPEFFKNLFLLIPNEMEANSLCPANLSVREQAAFFIECGVENVIITLGDKGVFYSNNITHAYYKALNVNAVDTTGASDAFISALAVYLSEGNNMDSSITFANYAAGLSVTKEGVQTSLPKRDQLREFEKSKF